MTTIDNLLGEKSTLLYNQLVNTFDLRKYRSKCAYDSFKDHNDSFSLKKYLDPIRKYTKNYSRLIINSFQNHSRTLGPNSYIDQDLDYIKNIYMLSKSQPKGGEVMVADSSWEAGDIEFNYDNKDFKHDRLISSNKLENFFLNQIQYCDGPVIYLFILHEK